MGWLAKLLGYSPSSKRAGISLNDRDSWTVDLRKSDITVFIRELRMLFPEGSNICLEGTSVNSRIRKFFQSNRAETTTKVEGGTIWPRSRFFHIPLTNEIVQKLAEFTETHALPEICDHFHVYKDQELLLQGYDFLGHSVSLSDKIDEDLIKDFCEKTGCAYKKERLRKRPNFPQSRCEQTEE